MSRIGKLPVPVPAGVRVTAEGNTIEVTGPRGTLRRTLPSCLSIDVRDTEVILQRASDSKTDRTLHGTMRALVHNMVEGVSKGFEKVLEIEGVGYRVRAEKFGVLFELGHSHPILLFSPEGISISVTTPTELRVNGNDKELVGLTAAKIRSFRPPEVYTGKGIRYRGEHIRRKAGKGGART